MSARKGLVFSVAFLLCSSCAAGSFAGPPRHPGFTESAVLSITQGMTADALRARFGPPDRTEVMTCGTATPEPWQCMIWEYDLGPHPRGRYQSISNINSFTFSLSDHAPRLNHWRIDLMYPDPSPL